MQLSTKFGFAFLCMPKCASTSIEKEIKNYCNVNISGYPGLKHINAINFHKHILSFHKKVFPKKKIEIFCMMREPIQWAHSWYRYRTRSELRSPRNPAHSNYTGNMDFNEFVEGVLQKKQESFARIGMQSKFMCLADGSSGVDHIFPVEDMSRVESYLSGKIGKAVKIDASNVSPVKKFELDNELQAKLQIYFAKDYSLYNSIVTKTR